MYVGYWEFRLTFLLFGRLTVSETGRAGNLSADVIGGEPIEVGLCGGRKRIEIGRQLLRKRGKGAVRCRVVERPQIQPVWRLLVIVDLLLLLKRHRGRHLLRQLEALTRSQNCRVQNFPIIACVGNIYWRRIIILSIVFHSAY